jgi:hypothetical protein
MRIPLVLWIVLDIPGIVGATSAGLSIGVEQNEFSHRSAFIGG